MVIFFVVVCGIIMLQGCSVNEVSSNDYVYFDHDLFVLILASCDLAMNPKVKGCPLTQWALQI